MEQQNGHLYIQIACSLTQQVERIPIKFLSPGNIGLQSLSGDYQQQSQHGKCRSFWSICNLFGTLVDVTSNQMTTFLIMVSLFLISVLYLLRGSKSSSQHAAEQIALNASAAAAAVVAANSYRSPGSPGSSVRDYSTFNPYRYFSSNPTVASYESQTRHSPFNTSGNLNLSSADRSPTFRNARTFKAEPSDQNRSPRMNQSLLSSRSRLNTTDRDGIRLYSVNSESQQYADAGNPFSNFEFSPRNQNQSYDSSDNEDARHFERRVPPRY